MRFSVTFDKINNLLNGLNKFETDTNKGDTKRLIPSGVLRIENGFNDISHQWKDVSKAILELVMHMIHEDVMKEFKHDFNDIQLSQRQNSDGNLLNIYWRYNII